jgi:hypothetical protein
LIKKKSPRTLILIGGWCPLVYKEYFGNPVEISMQRTADLDFLVPNPPRIHKDVDVSLILEELGFDRELSLLEGYEKYVHPDLEVEFLTPERGRGRDKLYTIDKLHIKSRRNLTTRVRRATGGRGCLANLENQTNKNDRIFKIICDPFTRLLSIMPTDSCHSACSVPGSFCMEASQSYLSRFLLNP